MAWMTRRRALGVALMVGAAGVARAQALAAEVQRSLRIVDGTLPSEERVISVQKGDRLRWRITSNQPGELHLHAYRLSAKVVADQPTELAFTAMATGRFQVEWHPAAAPSAAPATAAHHGPPLATLEVHPR
jgi:hypothetical protein